MLQDFAGRGPSEPSCLSFMFHLVTWCVAGMSLFLSGVTDEMKQQHREGLFSVTHKSLVEVAER